MSYISYNGVKYGVCPCRPILKSLVLNLPLVNLIYSRKIRVSLISRLDNHAPVTGIHGDFRIFRDQKKINFRFMVPERFNNILVKISDVHEEHGRFTELAGHYNTHVEYLKEVTLDECLERAG